MGQPLGRIEGEHEQEGIPRREVVSRFAECYGVCRRQRADLVHHPAYYLIRNHLVDFFVTATPAVKARPESGGSLCYPPEVDPTVGAVEQFRSMVHRHGHFVANRIENSDRGRTEARFPLPASA